MVFKSPALLDLFEPGLLAVREFSQIARPLAVREFVFIVSINDVAPSPQSILVYTKLGPKNFALQLPPLTRGIPGYVTRITPDRFSGIGAWAAKAD
jgi:hypothetical protein